MAVDVHQYKTRLQDSIVPVISGFISICMFPDCYLIDYWKDKVIRSCGRLVTLQLKPNNSTHSKMKCIDDVYKEEFNDDFSGLRQWFHVTAYHYSHKTDLDDCLFPYADYQIVYEDNKERIESALRKLAYLIASQDEEGIINYINEF